MIRRTFLKTLVAGVGTSLIDRKRMMAEPRACSPVKTQESGNRRRRNYWIMLWL